MKCLRRMTHLLANYQPAYNQTIRIKVAFVKVSIYLQLTGDITAPIIEISLPEICNIITRQASVKWLSIDYKSESHLSLTGDMRESSAPITFECLIPTAIGDRMSFSFDTSPMLTSCRHKIIQVSVKHKISHVTSSDSSPVRRLSCLRQVIGSPPVNKMVID